MFRSLYLSIPANLSKPLRVFEQQGPECDMIFASESRIRWWRIQLREVVCPYYMPVLIYIEPKVLTSYLSIEKAGGFTFLSIIVPIGISSSEVQLAEDSHQWDLPQNSFDP